MRLAYEPERAASRYERGVDYGATGRVLAVHGHARLIWRKGHMAWSSRGSSSYNAAYLQVTRPCNDSGLLGCSIFNGGRLTLARIEEHLPTIRKAMGLPTLRIDDIKLGQTLVVGEA